MNTRKVYQRVAKRPRDKIVKQLHYTLNSSATIAEYTKHYLILTDPIQTAQTFKGFRWNFTFGSGPAGGDRMGIHWYIIVVEKNQVITNTALSVNSAPMSTTLGTPTPVPTNLYDPDEKVVVHSCGILQAATLDADFFGETKTMRKMKPGDQLVLVVGVSNLSAAAAQAVSLVGDWQMIALQ